MKNKFTLLFFTIFFAVFVFSVPRMAKAIPVVEVGANLFTNTITTIEQTIGTIEATISAIADDGMWVNDMMDRYLMPILKNAIVKTVYEMVENEVGTGNNGKPAFVTDWYDYLYTQPEQQTRVQMNSFFNSVSAGRLSSLNYEGAGQAYDQYLKKQAETAIYGSDQSFQTNIQNYASDPSTQMFDSGNFKAFSSYLECPNNPWCYSMEAEKQYSALSDINKTVAEKTVNNDGFLPKKVDGKIVTPGAMYQSAMEGVDQLGNQLIVNAITNEDLRGVAQLAIQLAVKSITQGIAE